MKILILTLADEPYWPIASISVPNKAAYAAKHGYDFRYYSRLFNSCHPASWNKLDILRTLWEEDYDWFFWTDADSLIMNNKIKLEEIIADTHANLIVVEDNNGLNFGQFLIRNWNWSMGIVLKADMKQEYLNHPWWEQAALTAALKEEGYGKVQVVDQSKLNRLIPTGPEHNTLDLVMERVRAAYQSGDFILHFAGMGGERAHLREQAMQIMEAEAR